MAFLIGKKLGMTQVFADDGTVTPVTVIRTAPMTVSQLRTKEKDGYAATQYEASFGKKKVKKESQFEAGEFQPGDIVKIAGITKGRGFQGAVKRHGFHGMPASHGHHHVLRHVGSIGQRFPQHTLKGMRMAGHMGAIRQTTRGLTVVSIDAAQNMMAIKGAVPGRKGTLLEITKI